MFTAKNNLMDSTLNIQLARQAGLISLPSYPNETWYSEYLYHLGAVASPFPFEVFRRKFILLDRHLTRDPEGKRNDLDKLIQNLCIELGY